MEMARRVFSSWQQVEDIELIRQDLIRVGILPDGGKISIYGASGGGILAQEFVTKYPSIVHKLILESTGSPVVAKKNSMTLIRNLADYDLHLAVECELLQKNGFSDFEKLSYILYNLGRRNDNAVKSMTDLVHGLNNGNIDDYNKFLKIPMFNLATQTDRLKMPSNTGCRVRLCEIWEHEILKYRHRGKRPINLGYEWVSFCLSDLLKEHAEKGISAPSYEFDLTRFPGQMLVISGNEDVVFSPEMARSLAKTCNHSVTALLVDGHGMEKNWKQVCNLRGEFLVKPLDSLINDPQFRSVSFTKANVRP